LSADLSIDEDSVDQLASFVDKLIDTNARPSLQPDWCRVVAVVALSTDSLADMQSSVL
jgi:hypothetical protein